MVTTVSDEPIEVPPSPRGRRWLRRCGYALAAVLVAVAVAIGLLLGLTPSVGDLPVRAGALMRSEGAGPRLPDLPSRLATAVVAVEDHRFYQHIGLDPVSLGRAAVGALRGQDEGGATIEVQLAKLVYTGGRQDWRAHAEQIGIALKLDRVYPKRELLMTYLDCVYFGHGFYGATAAAEGYFGRTPDQLDWSQAALLAGILQAPTDYDPIGHAASALARRDHVLERLGSVGALSSAQVRALEVTGLELRTG